MNHDQATELGKRIVNTMRPTPALTEWIEILEPLDFDAALLTFRELRDRTDNGLNIAAWNAAHRRADSTSVGTTRRRAGTPDEHCPHCDGCGYEPGPPITTTTDGRPLIANGQPHSYTTQQPCRCTQPTPARTTAPAHPSLLEEF